MPTDRSRAYADITLLHNIRLAAEVERLTLQLQATGPDSRLRRVAGIFEDEVIRGGWAGRRRFSLRVLRSLAYRLFRSRILPGLPPPATPPVADVLPIQYARLDDALRAWRRTSLAEAQRASGGLATSQTVNPMRRTTQATWERFVAARPDLPYLRALQPHSGQRGKLRVLVLLGGGGLGDALLFSPLLAALQQRLAPCEIVLLYEKSLITPLYAGNPTVACAVAAPWGELQDVAKAARWLGIFDLFVDTFCFLPRYLVCEQSRIDMDRHGAWLTGNYQLGDLIERFSSNLGMSLLDRACNTHVFDLLAAITGLPIGASSPLIFSPDPTAVGTVRDLGLPDRYVTIRDGSNPGDLAFARSLGLDRTTKQLSPAKWTEICAILRAYGLTIVQVGDSNDPPAAEADIDLRGRTQLSELCFVMKGAVAHVDTEGGLAHFARAVNVPSIVFFGVTSEAFFGYPSNLNLSSPACGRCWYSNATWLAHCPRGTDGPLCTASIDLEPLRKRLPVLIAARHRPQPRVLESALFTDLFAESSLPALSLGGWGLAWARRWAALHLDERVAPRIGIIAPLREESRWPGLVRLTQERNSTTKAMAVGSIYNMPVNDASYDVLLCVDVFADVSEREAALTDLLRLLTADGLLVIATELTTAPAQTMPSSCLDLSALAACVGATDDDEPLFDTDAIATSAAALWRTGATASPAIAWASLCLRPPRPGEAVAVARPMVALNAE